MSTKDYVPFSREKREKKLSTSSATARGLSAAPENLARFDANLLFLVLVEGAIEPERSVEVY